MSENDEEYFEEMMEELRKHRKRIKDPVTEEQMEEMAEFFSEESLGLLEIEAEDYHMGLDEDGFYILANLSPLDENPKNAYYFILRNPNFKQERTSQYKIDFVSSFDEEEENDLDAEMYTIGTAMNLINCMYLIVRHWKMIIDVEG